MQGPQEQEQGQPQEQEQGQPQEQEQEQGRRQPDPVQVLAEMGVQVGDDGKIDPKDHLAMYNTLRTLREQVRRHEDAAREAADKARLEAMGEQERMVEEARRAGYETAMQEHRGELLRTKLVAEASAAGFADPDDVLRYLELESLEPDTAAQAVSQLARDKPYLLRQQRPPVIEQGPKGSASPGDGGDWLAQVLRNRHRV